MAASSTASPAGTNSIGVAPLAPPPAATVPLVENVCR